MHVLQMDEGGQHLVSLGIADLERQELHVIGVRLKGAEESCGAFPTRMSRL